MITDMLSDFQDEFFELLKNKEYLKQVLENGKWSATEIAHQNLTHFDY
jgi:hypothetical protein